MFRFDLEFVHVMGQQWTQAGFQCRRHQPIDEEPMGLQAIFGFEEVTAFTSNPGRLINQELRITYAKKTKT
jgi:hypothetical protein